MLWPAEGVLENLDRFGALAPVDVLEEDDSPQLFTVSNSGEAYLVYESVCDVRDRITRYVAVRSDDEMIHRLVDGKVSMRDALDQHFVWAIDQSFDGAVVEITRLARGLASVPDGYKPEAGVRLRADHHYV
jgi:hypothetical protein